MCTRAGDMPVQASATKAAEEKILCPRRWHSPLRGEARATKRDADQTPSKLLTYLEC